MKLKLHKIDASERENGGGSERQILWKKEQESESKMVGNRWGIIVEWSRSPVEYAQNEDKTAWKSLSNHGRMEYQEYSKATLIKRVSDATWHKMLEDVLEPRKLCPLTTQKTLGKNQGQSYSYETCCKCSMALPIKSNVAATSKLEL